MVHLLDDYDIVSLAHVLQKQSLRCGIQYPTGHQVPSVCVCVRVCVCVCVRARTCCMTPSSSNLHSPHIPLLDGISLMAVKSHISSFWISLFITGYVISTRQISFVSINSLPSINYAVYVTWYTPGSTFIASKLFHISPSFWETLNDRIRLMLFCN